MSNTKIEAHVSNVTAMEHVAQELEKLFKPRAYKPVNTIEDIMYIEGQQSVVNYVRDKLVGRR